MTDQTLSNTLTSEHLMETITHLSAEIGPRRPTSPQEHAAAIYVHERIQQLNPRWEVVTQPFQSIAGFRARIAPPAALTGLSLLTGLCRNRTIHVTSGLVSTGLSLLTRDAFLFRPAPWGHWLSRGTSHNVIARIPPRQVVQNRIVFVAHLDSNVHRLTTHPRLVRQLPRTLGSITLMALVGGVLTVLSGKKQRWRALRTLFAGAALGGAALAVIDEMGPDVDGALGNASGVAALVGLAQHLNQHPLTSTEVILAFTGSATAVATGADVLATTYGHRWRDALWVVVNHVGAGELCWATQHGISPYAHYHPHPAAVQIMERVAAARPDLGLMGHTMLSLDEVSVLRDRDLRAVALMAYDRETGLIPHWQQHSDTLHAVDPTTLERAVHACWTAAQLVDRAEVMTPGEL